MASAESCAKIGNAKGTIITGPAGWAIDAGAAFAALFGIFGGGGGPPGLANFQFPNQSSTFSVTGWAFAVDLSVHWRIAPVRLTGFNATAYNLEIFCYVLTPDIDHFYEIQGELLLIMNEVLSSSKIEVT